MLWIAVFLPELSLQSHCRGALAQLADLPLVISDGVANRPHVHAANAVARAAGIAPLMPLTAARARAAELTVVPRTLEKEAAALQQLAVWLSQFSPMSCVEPAGASLEVSTTLKLFGGLATIIERISDGLRQLGYRAALGVAPTPLAAWLLAQAAPGAGMRGCREVAQLPARLNAIPLTLFAWPREIIEPLAALGLTRIGDLLAQPRAGLTRRFGDRVLCDLDRALARVPDPRLPIVSPETFFSHMELLFELTDSERLLMPVGMLAGELQGFLHARGAAVAEIVLTLKHNRALATTHRFGAVQPIRHAEDWLRLIRERIGAAVLPEAVTAISLAAERLVPYQARNESWLPTSARRHEQWQSLLARIGSRLGAGRVIAIALHDDHRPEQAWRTAAAVEGVGTPAAPQPHRTQEKPRPLWLLTEPRTLVTMDGAPQHHGALELLAGPERIETGWWDGNPVARDYFVARNPQQEVCWIFCDYRQEKRWYLHGYFA